jgi:hypothetical protein
VLAAVAAYAGLALLVEDVRSEDGAAGPASRPGRGAMSAGGPPPPSELVAEPGAREQL